MRKLTTGIIGIAAALLLSACTTGPVIDDAETDPEPEWEVTQPADPLPIDQLAAFSGVVMLDAGSNCTGTLIDTGVSDGPAWVLTNGHCTGDLSRFDQKTTLATEWAGEAQFLRAAGRTESTLSRDVVEIAYSTMRFTDTAVVRLEGTLGELTELGIRAVPITDDEPNRGDAVVNVGVPVQHLDPDDWFLRRGECTLGDQHTLIELTWTWLGAWSNDCPGIIQGSSGSPLLRLDSDGNPEAIVAVINTTTVGAERALGGPCFINQPCEVHDGVATLAADTSYAQSAAGIGRCFDLATGEFAVGGDCPLPVGDVWFESGGGTFRGGDLPDGVGRMPQVSAVGSDAGTMRTAVAPIGDAQVCLRAETYTGAIEQALPASGERWEHNGALVDVVLPEVEGHYHFCVVRGESYATAAAALFEVDRTPPTGPAEAEVTRVDQYGAVVVIPVFDPPEIVVARYTWGPPGELDCTDTASFTEFLIVPLVLESNDLPATYCLYGTDVAGNPTPVTTIDIPRR